MTEPIQLDPKDGGIASRKMWISILTMVLISLGGLLTIKYQTFAGQYPTFIGGILGAAGLYISGNLAHTWVIGKSINTNVSSISQKQ